VYAHTKPTESLLTAILTFILTLNAQRPPPQSRFSCRWVPLLTEHFSPVGGKGRVMGEPVDVVLSRTPHDHGKDTFTNQFVNAVAYAVGAPWVADILGDRIEQTE